MKENYKYLTIKKLVETNSNKKRAALTLNCSLRHINRMIKGYKQKGKAFFIYKNRGRKPAHAFDEKTKKLILNLYSTKYFGANFTHFSELLKKHENTTTSPSSIRNILMQEFILSPKARRSTKKNVKAHLEELQKKHNPKKKLLKLLIL